jgi:hypothetical protein
MNRTAAALAALGTVLASDRSALVEFSTGQRWEGAVREWLELGMSSQPELKLACLSTIAKVMHSASTMDATPVDLQAPSVTAPPLPTADAAYTVLFERLGPCCRRGVSSMDVLIATLSNVADSESRFAAYDVLTALVNMPASPDGAVSATWGLRKVLSAPGLFSTLLDRTTEQTKEGKEWKFSVMDAAARHSELPMLGEDLYGRIRTWVARGPYAADMAGPAMINA